MKYQPNYSQSFPAVTDVASRRRKATKILACLQEYFGTESLEGLACLDLGCSVGIIGAALANAGARVTGLDIDASALLQYPHDHRQDLRLVLGDACRTPLASDAFDIVICAQVYEHSPSLELLVQEVARVLRIDGVCFFSGPNRWAIMEEHYHLPFLSWLPRNWSHWLVRRSGRGSEYYEQPRSARELRRAFRRFEIRDLTPRLLTDPERFAIDEPFQGFHRLAHLVPRQGWSVVGAVVPNFNWLLIKRNA